MAINFPDSPSTNDTHVVGDRTWSWNGTYWHVKQGVTVSSLVDADSDTKIQVEESSDEDIIRFDTGGSERMVINASGNVGIGTATPNAFGGVNTHVYNTTIASLLVDNGTYVGEFYASASGVILGARSNHALRIVTNDTARMTITNTGNVGIGTATPAHPLHIGADGGVLALGADSDLQISAGANSLIDHNGNQNFWIRTRAASQDLYLASYNNLYLASGSSHTTRIAVTDTGNVGIGQPTPVATLGIEAAADPWVQMIDTGTGTQLFGVDGTAVYVASDVKPIYFKVGCTWNAHPGGSGTTVLECTTSGGIVNLPVSGAQIGLSTSSPTSMATTVQSANIYFYSTDGRLYWNSSSERSKTDIEDVEDAYADKVLDLRPVWFRSTCRDDRKDWGHWGLIAEEVDLVDQRLVSYGPIPRVDDDGDEITDDDGVTLNELDDDGENVLRPENVQYDRIIPLLINIIKRQDARLEALESA